MALWERPDQPVEAVVVRVDAVSDDQDPSVLTITWAALWGDLARVDR